MNKKDKFAEDFEELQREIVRDKISEVIKKNPANYREGLEEIGFTWYDDNSPSDEEEEAAAVPHNDIQKKLVAYFEGYFDLSDEILGAFQLERHSGRPNYPLIRKYFRIGNLPLKQLVLHGLNHDPTNLEYLFDLSFFHEFNNILPDLIEHFTKACHQETDPQKFSELAQEFHASVIGDGYDALLALRNMFDEDSDKRKIVDFLINEFKERRAPTPLEF